MFLNGIDRRLLASVYSRAVGLVSKFTDNVSAELAKATGIEQELVKNKLEALSQAAVSEYMEAVQRDSHEQITSQILSILDYLPKSELGDLAETLVNLTSFRRRISHDEETVGGPIDVAVITKGDGMVWLRRKHYFDLRDNPRYAARVKEEHRQHAE